MGLSHCAVRQPFFFLFVYFGSQLTVTVTMKPSVLLPE